MQNINLAEQRYVCERGRDGLVFMCTHVYDVMMWLFGNAVRNVALGL